MQVLAKNRVIDNVNDGTTQNNVLAPKMLNERLAKDEKC